MVRESKGHKAADTQRRATPSIVTRQSREVAHSRMGAIRQRAGNQGVQRLIGEQVEAVRPGTAAQAARSLPIQTKLTVSAPGDAHEREADRVADAVMRMAQEMPAASSEPASPTKVQRMCAECDDELEKQPSASVRRKEQGAAAPLATPSVAASISRLHGSGSALPATTRAFFEPRFGSDFSRVRVHADAAADRTAQAIDARAFTIGNDIVFRSGQYAPALNEGQRLLAHELTHVVQQGGGSRADIQRACGPKAIGAPPNCTPLMGAVIGERFKFSVNCDELLPAEADRLRMFAETIQSGETIETHGFASTDGDRLFNERLSCARAIAAQGVLVDVLTARGIAAPLRLYSHGANKGEATEQRSVVVSRTGTAPPVVSCAIDVRATHIGGALHAAPIWHLFIIHTDNTHLKPYSRYFRGGPGGPCRRPDTGSRGSIIMDVGPYVAGTVDWDPEAPSVTVMSGVAACSKLDCFKSELSRIDATCTSYSPAGPNSNTVVSTILSKCGLPRRKPVSFAPGWDDQNL